MGFVICGGFLFIGCVFGALLFNINASYGDRIAGVIRNVLITASIIGILLMVVGVCSCLKMPVYEYSVNIHYVDGYSKTIKFDSCEDPIIRANRGSYYFSYSEGSIPGVVRFDIISKTKKKK